MWRYLCAVTLAIGMAGQAAWAAITIPTTIDVDAIGTAALADAAPGMLAIVGVSIFLTVFFTIVALVRRRGPKAAKG